MSLQVIRTDFAGLRFVAPLDDQPMSPDRFASIAGGLAGVLPAAMPVFMMAMPSRHYQLEQIPHAMTWEPLRHSYLRVHFASPLDIIIAVGATAGAAGAIKWRHSSFVIQILEFIRDYKAQQRASLAAARTQEDRAVLYGHMCRTLGDALDPANLATLDRVDRIFCSSSDVPSASPLSALVSEAVADESGRTVGRRIPKGALPGLDDWFGGVGASQVVHERTPDSVMRSVQQLPDDFTVETLGSQPQEDE